MNIKALYVKKVHSYIDEIRELLRISFPLMMALLIDTGKSSVDTIMVGNIDASNLAGMSLATGIYVLIIVFSGGFGHAMVSILSRLHAQKDYKNFNYFVQQSVYINLFLGAILSVFLLNCDFVFTNLDLGQGTKDIAISYLHSFGYFYLLINLYGVIQPILQTFVKNKTMMMISVFTFLLNIPLNYLFIYVMDMGAVGSAYATIICQVLGTVMVAGIAFNIKEISILENFALPNKREIVNLFKLGVPVGIETIMVIGAFTAISFLLTIYDETVVAANQVVMSYCGLIFMFALGVYMALIQRISFYIGLDDVKKVKEVIVSGIYLAVGISLVTISFTVLFKSQIIGLYTSDSEIIKIAEKILYIFPLYLILDNTRIVLTSILRAFKLNKESFVVSFISYWIIGLGLGYVLSSDYGVYGYWSGMCFCFIVSCVLSYSIGSRKLKEL